jgi:TatD DNase family protein
VISAIDTHAHLDHVQDVERALEEAYTAGVKGVVAVGTDLESNKRNLKIKRKTVNPKIFTALGIHPESLEHKDGRNVEETVRFIREQKSEAVAIGEIGLDYWYKWVKKNEEKKKEQKKVFALQLDLAKEWNLPVIIHSRGSWRDCLDMTKNAGIKKAVFHWYSGPVDILDGILSCGYFISAGPALAYSPPLQMAVQHAPIERMLIETDSPVFYGEPDKGFHAGPKHVLTTLSLYADLKNIKQEEAAEIFYKNSKDFFNLSL